MGHTSDNPLTHVPVATGARSIILAGMTSNVRRKKKVPDFHPGPLMSCQLMASVKVIARRIVGAYITNLNHEHRRRRVRPVALSASAIHPLVYLIQAWCRTLNERESASLQFGKC